MNILQGIHFYIQPEVNPQVQDALRHAIAELGGIVDVNVPDTGYVLADLNSPNLVQVFRLFAPNRWVVPLSYVDQCKSAGVQLKPIFLEDASPMPIHIHESIANPKFRESLYERIMLCAGFPYASVEDARVILADSKTSVFSSLIKMYQLTPNKYIESLEWIEKCIERQEVSFTPHVFKNPGGRKAGEERTQFTEDDEQKLCEWIAAKIPFKSVGGRTGNKLYQQLCEMSNHPDYAWVSRHTWQSWRERYKKNSARLDKIIDNIVSTQKPNLGEKWHFGYVRQDEERPKKKRKRLLKSEEEQQLSQEFVVGSSKKPLDPAMTQAMAPPMGQFVGTLQLAPAPPMPSANDNDDWSIRIGNDAPPSWAKPRDSEEGNVTPDTKASETNDGITDHTALHAITAVVVGHVLDQTLGEIALQTRFTIEEVREYYSKHNDMNRTRSRFQKMREHLNQLPDDE